MKESNKAEITIERNNEKSEFDFSILRPNKFDIIMPHIKNKNPVYLKDSVNIVVKDNDYVFSFYGENGVGKSTFCKKIRSRKNNNIKIIDIKEKMNLVLKYPCILSDVKNQHMNFSDFFLKGFDRSYFGVTPEKEKEIDSLIDKWLEKKSIHIENCLNTFFNLKKGESNIYYIIRHIDEYTNAKKISIEHFLYHHKKYEYDKHNEYSEINSNNKCIKILNEPEIGNLILSYIKEIYQKTKPLIKDFKTTIKESVKHIDFIKKVFLDDFILFSSTFIDDLKIKDNYSGFLDLDYKEFLIMRKGIESKATGEFIHDFYDRTSEGQKKLIKLIFIIAEIGVNSDNKTMILADDIFDSFDNKNILYLTNILFKAISIKKPLLMLFTHDIEVFTMANKILRVKNDSSFIVSRDKKILEVKKLNIKDATLESYIKSKTHANTIHLKILYFIVLSVYGRNLIERTLGQKNIYYEKITNLLHLKMNSQMVMSNVNEIANLEFFDFFSNNDIKEIEKFSKGFKSYFHMMESIFKYCLKNNIDKIELNIFLSLYGRLCIENIILKKLKNKGVDTKSLLSSIKTYQTGFLIKEYNKIYGPNDNIKALNDYIIKFIHINQGLSYLINIDSKIIFKLIKKIK